MRSARIRACVAAALLAAATFAPPAAAQQVRMLVQSSPLAGFRYHQAPEVWRDLRVGDALRLAREPDNAFDARAVRVEWRGHMLGYVPRAHNATLAWAMDRGEVLEARVSRLRDRRSPRRRVEFEIYVE